MDSCFEYLGCSLDAKVQCEFATIGVGCWAAPDPSPVAANGRVYERLKLHVEQSRSQSSSTNVALWICFSTRVTFDHAGICEILSLWNF